MYSRLILKWQCPIQLYSQCYNLMTFFFHVRFCYQHSNRLFIYLRLTLRPLQIRDNQTADIYLYFTGNAVKQFHGSMQKTAVDFCRVVSLFHFPIRWMRKYNICRFKNYIHLSNWYDSVKDYSWKHAI